MPNLCWKPLEMSLFFGYRWIGFSPNGRWLGSTTTTFVCAIVCRMNESSDFLGFGTIMTKFPACTLLSIRYCTHLCSKSTRRPIWFIEGQADILLIHSVSNDICMISRIFTLIAGTHSKIKKKNTAALVHLTEQYMTVDCSLWTPKLTTCHTRSYHNHR